MKRQSITRYVIELYKRIEDHDALGYSAGLAYFFLLSLFPLLITMFSLVPYLPIESKHIFTFIEDFAPGETATFIQKNLETIFAKHNGGLLSFGVIATLWAASNGMNGIIRAVNRAYEIEENRPFIFVRGMSVLFTIVMIFVFVIALLLPVFGQNIGVFLFSIFDLADEFIQIWNTLRWGVSSIILIIVFSAIYILTQTGKFVVYRYFRGNFLNDWLDGRFL